MSQLSSRWAAARESSLERERSLHPLGQLVVKRSSCISTGIALTEALGEARGELARLARLLGVRCRRRDSGRPTRTSSDLPLGDELAQLLQSPACSPGAAPARSASRSCPWGR